MEATSDVEAPRPAEGPTEPSRLRSYRLVGGVYAGALAAGLLAARRRFGEHPPSPGSQWADVALVGLSTFKISRLLAKQTVTAPIRAPFTVDEGSAGPGERHSRPVGDGWRRSVGELLSCPFCLDVWIGTAGTFGLHLAPQVARPVLGSFAAVGLADMLHFVYVGLEHRAEG